MEEVEEEPSAVLEVASEERLEEAEDSAILVKTEWKRKGDRVNFFTKEAANTDFFDLVGSHRASSTD